MILSPSELETIRLKPQQTELYLSIFQPTTALACQVTGTLARDSYQIPYMAVSSGSYLSVESGMTLLVGTTAGGRELGKIRVRSATPTHIIVSENSSIDWTLATHLTVLRYWEVWPVYPRIIPDPNNAENVIFYKDYDIAYTNQNSILGAFPCAGSHLAGWVGDSFYFSSTGTVHLVTGTTLTHNWAFEGATITGSTSAHPGNITWNTPGHFVVRYRATGANGSIDTTYRYVSIYNRPANSSQNVPISKWGFDTLSGSRDEGGYTTNIHITDENISLNDGDVVVLFSENWYGQQSISLGGNTRNPSIFFSGHILNNSIKFNYKSKVTEFEVGSISALMKMMEGFSISVESKISPSTWFELLDMDGRRALYHYLRWHSTVLYLADFQFLGNDQKIHFFDSDRTSIYDAVDNYMRGTLEGKVCTDLQGKLWAEINAQASPNPTGSFPSVMTINKGDWIGEPSIVENTYPTVSYLERGGVAFSGVFTGTFSALLASAPGSVPGFRGTEDKNQGMALASQTQLNELVGNLFANKNARFPEISMNMAGNYRNLDIAPQNSVTPNITSADNNRNIAINNPYIVNGLNWTYDVKNKILLVGANYKVLLNGFSGATITIPPVEDISVGGGFNVPNFRIPNLSPFTPMIGTGIRFFGARIQNNNVQNGTFTGTCWNNPAVSSEFYPFSDRALIGAGSLVASRTLINSGLYLIVAIPSVSFPVTTATLIFTPPVSNNFDNTFRFDDEAMPLFVRPVYYTGGQIIKFDIAYTGGTPGEFDFVEVQLWAIKLT